MLTIYLDQNKWIDLAKAESNRPDGARFLSVLSAARRAVLKGTVVFPLSFPHLHETARAPKLSQREQLARLMTELSQGIVLRTAQQVITEELRHAVRAFFGEPAIDRTLSPLARGVEAAVNFRLDAVLPNLPADRLAQLRAGLDSPAAWIDLLSHSTDQWRTQTISSLDHIGNHAASAHQQDRTLLSDSDKEEVRRVFLARTTLHFLPQIEAALSEIGRTMVEWGESGPDRLVAFWESIPCVRAHMELEVALHCEKSKTWSRNDLADLNALGLAIPYCNVVITERFWVHTATRLGLDRLFETTLHSDLCDLEPHLTRS